MSEREVTMMCLYAPALALIPLLFFRAFVFIVDWLCEGRTHAVKMLRDDMRLAS
jgi:hypothetical protein